MKTTPRRRYDPGQFHQKRLSMIHISSIQTHLKPISDDIACIKNHVILCFSRNIHVALLLIATGSFTNGTQRELS